MWWQRAGETQRGWGVQGHKGPQIICWHVAVVRVESRPSHSPVTGSGALSFIDCGLPSVNHKSSAGHIKYGVRH